MACQVTRNKERIPIKVTAKNGNQSELFNKLASIIGIDNKMALDLYKASLSKKVKNKIGDFSKFTTSERMSKQGLFDKNGEMKLFFKSSNGVIVDSYSEALKNGGGKIEIGYIATEDVLPISSETDLNIQKNDVLSFGNMSNILQNHKKEIMNLLNISVECN